MCFPSGSSIPREDLSVTFVPMTIAELVAAAASRLTPAERQVADVVAADPHAVAFGTVAELAQRSGTSGPTVLRFAAKLGLQGFADLQAVAQTEITDALRPATARIRERQIGRASCRERV